MKDIIVVHYFNNFDTLAACRSHIKSVIATCRSHSDATSCFDSLMRRVSYTILNSDPTSEFKPKPSFFTFLVAQTAVAAARVIISAS